MQMSVITSIPVLVHRHLLINVTDVRNCLWEEETINNRTGKNEHRGNFVQAIYLFVKFSTVFCWKLSSARPVLVQVINSIAHKKQTHILNNRPRPWWGRQPCLNDCSSPEKDSADCRRDGPDRAHCLPHLRPSVPPFQPRSEAPQPQPLESIVSVLSVIYFQGQNESASPLFSCSFWHATKLIGSQGIGAGSSCFALAGPSGAPINQLIHCVRERPFSIQFMTCFQKSRG